MRSSPCRQSQAAWVLLAILVAGPRLRAADCNLNRVEDGQDIAEGRSQDCNRNRVPDECDLLAEAPALSLLAALPAGLQPQSLASGDWNGDGLLDLVVSRRGAQSLAILDNDGGGAFTAREPVPTVDPARAISGDLNGDGLADILWTDADPSVAVLIQESEGRFRPLIRHAMGGNAGLMSSLEDLDGDGDLDAVAGRSPPAGHFVLRNRGDGVLDPVAIGPVAGSTAAGDVDGDGRIDLAVARSSSAQVEILRQSGDLSFESLGVIPLREPPSSVLLRDLDLDQDLDLVLGQPDEVSVLLGAGDGRFGPEMTTNLGSSVAHLVPADLNQDGYPDLLAGAGSRIYLLESDRKGGLARPRRLFQVPNLQFLSVGDFDGDGDGDVAVADGIRQVWILESSVAPHGALDCDRDGILDGCGPEDDSDSNGVVDGCDPDCNGNGIPDVLDVSRGATPTSLDCDRDGVPDECLPPEKDRDRSGVPDSCEIEDGLLADLDSNGIPDSFQEPSGSFQDCDGDGVTDELQLRPPPELEGVELVVRGTGWFLATGDFDGDGHEDIAAAGPDKLVTLHWNDGDGSFRQRRRWSLPRQAASIAAGDMEGDSDLDLVIPDGVGGISILLNQGGADFRVREHSLGHPQHAGEFSLCNLDGDGDLDLAFASPSRSSVIVFFNRGEEGWSPAVVVPSPPETWGVVFADLDGDGDLDLSSSGGLTGEVQVHRNQDDGTFGSLRIRSGSGCCGSMLAGDLDGDGAPDLAVADLSPAAFSILYNGGDGSFPAPAKTVSSSGEVLGLALLDLEGDGRLDVAAADRATNRVQLVSNRGSRSWTVQMGPMVGTSPRSMEVMDIEGDGRSDLAVEIQGEGTVSLLRNEGGSRFRGDLRLELEEKPRSVLMADLEGDGDLDVIGASGSGMRPFLNQNGTLRAGVDIAVVQANLTSFLAQDLDGDGRVDPAGLNSSGEEVRIFVPHGAGFRDGPRIPVGRFSSSISGADLDGDGLPEMVVTRTTGVLVLKNQGSLTFAPHVELPAAVKAVRTILEDLDGDRHTDLVVLTTGETTIFRNQGGGSFGPGSTYFVSGTLAAAGDVDGDLRIDLLLGDESEGGPVVVLRNRGGGSLITGGEIDLPDPPSGLELEDLDGDGDEDLIVFHWHTSQVSLHFNWGDGRFTRSAGYAGGRRPEALAVGDLDRDGRPDLVVAAGDAAYLTVLYSRTGPQAGPDCDRNGILDACDIDSGRAEDGDGDGILDVCQGTPFHRGDPNQDGALDLSDGIRLLTFLFIGEPEPACLEAADSNDDGGLDLSDAIYIYEFLFLGGPAPPDPGPPGGPCSPDPDPGDAQGRLGCDLYLPCQEGGE